MSQTNYDITDRVTFIQYILDNFREAVYIESMHRWYFDEYTTQLSVTDREKVKAVQYKMMVAGMPKWRWILHRAHELELPLPGTLNLKRYSDF